MTDQPRKHLTGVSSAGLAENLVARSVCMRLAQVGDAEFILSLRTDPTKNQHLTETPDDVPAQRRWLEAYKSREAALNEFYFIVETLSGERCGVVRVYDIEGTSFTWGSWIIGKNAPKTAAIESALLIYLFAFDRLCLTDCRFEVRSGNQKALAFHDRFGAKRTYSDDVNQYFIYQKHRWDADRPKFAEFLV